MASKRKSTIPCMIPVKTLHLQEDLEHGCVSLSAKEIGSSQQDEASEKGFPSLGEPSGQDAADVQKDAGTYTCRPCNFETQDLNLFLDHVYSGHPEFRADPSFLCVDCGVSAAKFEGLALHNARVHPSNLTTTLQLKKKDRKITVEQNLIVGPGESSSKDSEISITKTPIMKMLKGKSEPKRIVVSHPASDEGVPALAKQSEESPAVTVTHVPTIVHNGAASKVTLPSAIQIVNGSGALPMLKTAITQVVSVVQNRSLNQQSTPHGPPSSVSSRNLPKVMIPLSSIPTYNASMDNSSFLKTSFSKFPYPTKAELCYLTVVTKYPEEQIKIWFTAQRLKQGISWSPEEIEDARRKMFNTIIQTAPPAGTQQRHAHHSSPQQTITVLPASLGTASIPHILQGSLVGQGGVIVTQPMVTNGLQVSSTPVALAVTPKPQAKPPTQAKPAAALMAEKGLSVVVGTVGSSSANFPLSNGASSSIISGVGTSGALRSPASVISIAAGGNGKVISSTKVTTLNHSSKSSAPSNSSNNNNVKTVADNKNGTNLKSNISKSSTDIKGSGDAKGNGDEVKSSGGSSPCVTVSASPATTDGLPGQPDSPPPASANSRTLSTTSFLDPSFYKAKKSQEQLSALKESFLLSQFPNQEEVDRLTSLTGLSVREVRKWFSDRRYHFRNLKGSRSSTGGPSAASGNTAPPAPAPEPSDSAVAAERPRTPQPIPLSPSRQQTTTTTPPTPTRRPPRPPSPDFTAIRYKEREPHQVRALEASFTQEPHPAGEEVDRLRAETKMTRREIHGWFAERRKRVAAEKKKEELERAEREEEEPEEKEGVSENGRKDAAEASRGSDESSSDTPQQPKDEKFKEDASGTELKVNPIKINLKMLKVTESNGKGDVEGSPQPDPAKGAPGQVATPPSLPAQTPYRGKKTPEQLHLLKQAFARTHWPGSVLYNDLITQTGLPRPEVVRWFGDCRYVLKHGQLKWLDSYQSMVDEEDLVKADVGVLRQHLEAHGRLAEDQLEELAKASGLGEELVRRWFTRQTSAPPPSGSTKSDETETGDAKASSSVTKGNASLKTAQQSERTAKGEEAERPASSVTSKEQSSTTTSAPSVGSEQQGCD